MKAYLQLADNTVLEGESMGAVGVVIGEIVFNTGMTGYQEVLTDPSYYGHIVTMTYPIQGNYGINTEDFESEKPFVSGFIVREHCDNPSNFRSAGTLDDYLAKNNIIGIKGIDTRALTRRIREAGVINGAIVSGENARELVSSGALLQKIGGYAIKDAVKAVTEGGRTVYSPDDKKAQYKVALYDYGSKKNILRSLLSRGCEVTVFGAYEPVKAVLEGGFDGVMLSNGPGDPAENTGLFPGIKQIITSGMPVFGICLGHQLCALSMGAKTSKLKYGHRGANHPVLDLAKGRTYITSQNHGYAVIGDSIPKELGEISFINVNDGTVEGVKYKNFPVFTVQFHPEASPGPRDSAYLFDEFIDMMKERKSQCR